MIDFSTVRKAWAMLDARERRNAWIVLGVMIIEAAASALMVGSIMPFLAVLADPGRIERTPALAWAYETFGFTTDYGFLIGLGVGSFAVIVFSSFVQIVRTWSLARFANMRTCSISHRLLESYLGQPYAFFLNRHSGEMGPRILVESGQVVQQFLLPAAELVSASLTTLAILGLLVWVEPVVAILAFVIVGGLYALIYSFTRRHLKSLGKTRVENNQKRFRIANEALTGIKDIKLLVRETAYLQRYTVPATRMARAQVQVAIFSQVPQSVLQAVSLGGVLMLCLALIDPVDISSGAGLGGLLPILGVFAFAGQRLMPELSKLYQSLARIQAGTAAVDNVYEDLVQKRSSRVLHKGRPSALGLKQALQLEDVSYSYPNADQAGIKNVSFVITAGEKIGIVGSTGAGKTTLADIVLGLLEPTQGRLIVDHTPITAKNTRDWMRTVGYVPQDIFLTDAPVSENIALGVKPEAIDIERVRKAAKIARIDAFIMEELTEGYATHVGERGVRLSGGQRQRIGIARALYHDADLIVFDEATSALDNLTEREVMSAIDALPGDKTVMMIAHRLSTVKRCDRIIVLDQGQLVGCDTWDTLLRENPIFQRIADLKS